MTDMVVGRQRCRLDRTVVTRRCTRSQEMDGVSQGGKLVIFIYARMKGKSSVDNDAIDAVSTLVQVPPRRLNPNQVFPNVLRYFG
jgi:hypothetical protein